LRNDPKIDSALTQYCGDYKNDPDAAYRASKVLDYIKSSKASDGNTRSDAVTKDATIEGFSTTGSGDVIGARGTEAEQLVNFMHNGYTGLSSNHQLSAPDGDLFDGSPDSMLNAGTGQEGVTKDGTIAQGGTGSMYVGAAE
jgi:hypothetical protein